MKKAISLMLVLVLVIAFSTAVFAGGHGRNQGQHHGARTTTTWHEATDYWQGHWSNQCVNHDHVWNTAAHDSRHH